MNSEFTIAVHSLVLLVYRPDHMATSDMIADNVCTHPARVRKVMSMLRKHGYVATKEGTGGGYLLDCDPSRTTLAEIYRAVSYGSIIPSWCSGDPEKSCMVAANIRQVMDRIFTEAERHLLLHLETLSICDVLDQIREARSNPL